MNETIQDYIQDPRRVQFYSATARELEQSQRNKILKFLEHECIDYAGDNVFICKPIPGYNKTCYRMTKLLNGEFDCNCQGYMTRYNRGDKHPSCSHIGALFEYFARKKKK